MDMFATWWTLVSIILAALLVGTGLELRVILRRDWGGTFTHWLRRVFSVHEPDGKRIWLTLIVTIIGILAWLGGHVVNWWP